ncbi:LamG-like jellyroll fold domain-containing protein [Lacipirellula sp.]|uniref:LamG-like jellyroll fold domain-containing protein n=1 Tax=Lacipirellula sp. TaxID=2691419 RepID=UPI003D0F536A
MTRIPRLSFTAAILSSMALFCVSNASAEVVFSYDSALGTLPTAQGWAAFEVDTTGPLTAANVAGTAAANANAVIETVGGVPTLHMRDTLSDTGFDLPSYLYAWTTQQQETLLQKGVKFTMVWQGLTAGASNGNVRFGFNNTQFEAQNSNIPADRTIEVTNFSSTLAPLDGQFHTLTIYGRKVGTEFIFSSSVDGAAEVSRSIIVNPAPTQLESAVYFGGNSSASLGTDILVRTVTMETLPLTATIDRNAGPRGTLKIINNSTPLNIVGYSIASAGGGLDPTGWTSITDAYDAGGNQSVDPNDQWAKLSGASVRNNLAEFEPDGDGANFATGQTINLGNVWVQSPTEDLAVELLLADGSVVPVHIGYYGNGNQRFKFGDLDFDGDFDVADFQTKFRPSFGTNTLAKSEAERYQAGDFNSDGTVDEFDFLQLNSAYLAANPGAAPLSFAVPEPASAGLLALGATLLACGRRARGRARRAGAATIAAAVVVSGSAGAEAADLIAHWKFDEAAGATTAVDAIGGVHNATKAGNANSGAAGIIGNAWQFGGTTADHLAVATSASNDALLTLGENFSVSGWVKTSATTLGTMFSISDNSVANEEVMFRAVSDQGPLGIASGSADFSGRPTVGTGEAVTVSKVNNGQWRFLTYAQNTTGWGLYVDGVLEDSGVAADGLASPAAIGANIVTIGAHNRMGTTTPGYTWALNGAIDDLAVWNGRLTDGEVQNRYLAGLNGVNAATPFTAKLALKVNETTGAVSLVNTSGAAFDIDLYRIRSAGNSLAPGQWLSLDDSSFDFNVWSELAATAGKVSEGAFGESTLLATGISDVSLGTLYNKTINAKDLVFEYHVAGTPDTILYAGAVSYVTGGASGADFDANGIVDGADFLRWQRNFGISNGSATKAQGDANGDGNVNAADLTVWKTQFGTPGSATSAVATVPEPTTFALAALTLAAILVVHHRPKRLAAVRSVACGTAVFFALSATTATAAVTVDRNYRLGDDGAEGASIGAVLGSGNAFSSTFDSAGTSGAGDLQDLNIAGGPTYISVSDRPGAGSTRGASFDGVDDYLWTPIHLAVPSDVWDSTTLFPSTPFPHNYEGIRGQMMQLWVKPNSAQQNVRQELINNTGEHGVVITEDNKWGLLSDAEPVINSGVAVGFNQWSHVQMISGFSDRVNGRSNVGGALLINGVAVAARNDAVEFNVNQLLTVGGSRVTQDLSVTNPFRGVIDDVKISVWGTSSANATNYGTLNLATDNEWIATQLAGKPLADVNLDGVVSGTGTGPAATDDVTKMLQGWGTTKLVNGVQFGDWTTRQQGDLNFDGEVDLYDAFMLRQAFKGLGLQLNMEVFAVGVPEPTSLGLAAMGMFAVAYARRRKETSNQ